MTNTNYMIIKQTEMGSMSNLLHLKSHTPSLPQHMEPAERKDQYDQ